ncbi:hypothetical protein C8Q73DRAFT_413898 [Cubamyces lactineus]|nr:hypothetical protein C8Q73DRAFT_413898 [Cubamyces lactineus]
MKEELWGNTSLRSIRNLTLSLGFPPLSSFSTFHRGRSALHKHSRSVAGGACYKTRVKRNSEVEERVGPCKGSRPCSAISAPLSNPVLYGCDSRLSRPGYCSFRARWPDPRCSDKASQLHWDLANALRQCIPLGLRRDTPEHSKGKLLPSSATNATAVVTALGAPALVRQIGVRRDGVSGAMLCMLTRSSWGRTYSRSAPSAAKRPGAASGEKDEKHQIMAVEAAPTSAPYFWSAH